MSVMAVTVVMRAPAVSWSHSVMTSVDQQKGGHLHYFQKGIAVAAYVGEGELLKFVPVVKFRDETNDSEW